MSLPRKALVSLVLLLVTGTLAACGFQPVYGKYSAAQVGSADMQNVRIKPIADRMGQQLSNKLVDRMYTTGRPKNTPYELEVTLSPIERSIGIQKDATATRGELLMAATIVVYDTATQASLYTSTIRTRVAYNILEGQYGNLIARENAYDRALDDIAGEIVSRVALFLNRTSGTTDAAE